MNVINPNKFADQSLVKAYAKTGVDRKQNGHQTHLNVYTTGENFV